MSAIFGFKQPVGELSLLIDIGSDGVAAALVLFYESKTPCIIFSCRDSLPFAGKNVTRMLPKMITSLESIIAEVENEGIRQLASTKFSSHRIRNVYCTFSSPWYLSKTRIVEFKRAVEFDITSKLLLSLKENEEKQFIADIDSEKEIPHIKESLEVLESRISSVKIDGKYTQHPIGKKTNEMDVAVYISVTASDIVKKIENAITKRFHYKKIEYFTSPLVGFKALRYIQKTPPHFLQVDIAAEVTEINVIKDHTLVESITIPYGRNYFVGRIADILPTKPQIALSFIKLSIHGKGETSHQGTINEELKKLSKEWRKHFDNALLSFSPGFTPPKELFLMCDPHFLLFFKEILEEQQLSQTGTSFAVTQVDHTYLGDLYRIAKSVKDDPYLASEAVFAHYVRNEKDNLIL